MEANLSRSLILIGALTCLSTPGYAEEEDGSENGGFFTPAGSLLIASDYMFRSISNSNNGPTVQGDMNWSADNGFYVGIWASNTNFGGPGNSMELDPYIGFAATVPETEWSFDIGYWSYNYPKSEFDLDYAEVYLNLSYTWDKLSISPSFWFADNYFGKDFLDDVHALAYEVTLAYELPCDLSTSLRVGEQTFESSVDYLDFVYYDVGIDWSIGDYSLGLRWYDTDGVDPFLAATKLTDGRFVFGITRSF